MIIKLGKVNWVERWVLIFCGCNMFKKVCLGSYPFVLLFFFKVSSKVSQEINKLQRNFLWGWDGVGRKIVWIKWKTPHKAEEYGGPGIKDINLFNINLLGK